MDITVRPTVLFECVNFEYSECRTHQYAFSHILSLPFSAACWLTTISVQNNDHGMIFVVADHGDDVRSVERIYSSVRAEDNIGE